MPVHKNYHVSRTVHRYAHVLIASLIVLVMVLSVSAGKAWSHNDAKMPPIPVEKPIL